MQQILDWLCPLLCPDNIITIVALLLALVILFLTLAWMVTECLYYRRALNRRADPKLSADLEALIAHVEDDRTAAARPAVPAAPEAPPLPETSVELRRRLHRQTSKHT